MQRVCTELYMKTVAKWLRQAIASIICRFDSYQSSHFSMILVITYSDTYYKCEIKSTVESAALSDGLPHYDDLH